PRQTSLEAPVYLVGEDEVLFAGDEGQGTPQFRDRSYPYFRKGLDYTFRAQAAHA
ncbi:hypothetical protein LCGC14_1967820, partial [marine sediment metagenome]